MVVTDTLDLAEAILVYTLAIISLQAAGSALGGVSDTLLGLILVGIRNDILLRLVLIGVRDGLLLGLWRKK